MFGVKSLDNMQNFFQKGYTLELEARLGWLRCLYKNIKVYHKEIQTSLYKDLGKSEEESYMTEIAPVLSEISYYIKNLHRLALPKIVPFDISSFPSIGKIMPSPYGCVLVLSPWNYPINLTLKPLVSAIASGNCVVIKPSELAPNAANIIKKLMDITFPQRVCRVVLGGEQVAEQLLRLKFNYIFFTGSYKIGRRVMAAAAKNITPLTLELGGKSPCIINDTKNMEITARRICWGKLLNSGQTCVAPDYIFIKREILYSFMKKYKSCVKRFFGVNPINNLKYPKIINRRHFYRLKDMIEECDNVIGGRSSIKDLKIEPCIIVDPDKSCKVMEEEIFGPILPIIPYDNILEVMNYIRNKPTPLALYIFSQDKVLCRKLIKNLSFGGCAINDTISHIINKGMPFGGMGESGFGQYNGKYGFQTFSHNKSILEKKTNFDIPIKFPPYGFIKSAVIKMVLR